jgi:hypothetical protein
VLRLGNPAEVASTPVMTGPVGNHYKLPTAPLSRHVRHPWQIRCPHPRILKAYACRHFRQERLRLRIRHHLQRQRMSKRESTNGHRVESVTRCRLSKFLTLSDASPLSTLMFPVRLITLRSTKFILSLRVAPPQLQRRCLLRLRRNRCPLQRRRRLPSTWRSRSLSRCQL